MNVICFERFSSKGKKFATVHCTESLINVIKTKQGRKDGPVLGTYSYNIRISGKDWENIKKLPNVVLWPAEDVNGFLKKIHETITVLAV